MNRHHNRIKTRLQNIVVQVHDKAILVCKINLIYFKSSRSIIDNINYFMKKDFAWWLNREE